MTQFHDRYQGIVVLDDGKVFRSGQFMLTEIGRRAATQWVQGYERVYGARVAATFVDVLYSHDPGCSDADYVEWAKPVAIN